MPKFKVKAWDSSEDTIETTIVASDRDAAVKIGWQMFPEYHEMGVWEINDNKNMRSDINSPLDK